MRFRRPLNDQDTPAVTVIDPAEAFGWAGLPSSRVTLEPLAQARRRRHTRQETLFPSSRRYGHVRSR